MAAKSTMARWKSRSTIKILSDFCLSRIRTTGTILCEQEYLHPCHLIFSFVSQFFKLHLVLFSLKLNEHPWLNFKNKNIILFSRNWVAYRTSFVHVLHEWIPIMHGVLYSKKALSYKCSNRSRTTLNMTNNWCKRNKTNLILKHDHALVYHIFKPLSSHLINIVKHKQQRQ